MNIYVIMGVSGCGKTTIGKALAEKLGLKFLDADNFHSEKNVQKMANKIPLTDEDRADWLKELNIQIKENQENALVLSCSALKEKYRRILNQNLEHAIKFVLLKGDFEIIHSRLQLRKNHFMSSEMLKSQFDILEEPFDAIKIDIKNKTPEIIVNIIINNLKEFGLVGLGVMGKSLARNFAGKSIQLSLYNRYVKDKEENVAQKFISEYSELRNCLGFEDLESFVASLQKPRKIFLMINAGKIIDDFIAQLLPFLDKDDIIIEGGNSHYLDTKRRINYLAEKQIHFIGTGVSGGEKGALEGPSIMPSGHIDAYLEVAPYLNKISAKDKTGKDCCTYIGPDGSGHFVKMIHNGIEYAEMQLIAEVYGYFRYISKFNPDQIAEIFTNWNSGEAKSYLLEISSKILVKKENGSWLIDEILDKAGNKGTGNWATLTASENGVPATIITSALFGRYLSTIKNNFTNLKLSAPTFTQVPTETIEKAYNLARMLNHQQGFYLIKKISDENNWELNLSEIARIWTNGCIIRSQMMEELVESFIIAPEIFESEIWKSKISKFHDALKTFCVAGLQGNLPMPSHLSSLDYLNTLGSGIRTANMIQAQRDFFGAHTYQKLNDDSGVFYHSIW